MGLIWFFPSGSPASSAACEPLAVGPCPLHASVILHWRVTFAHTHLSLGDGEMGVHLASWPVDVWFRSGDFHPHSSARREICDAAFGRCWENFNFNFNFNDFTWLMATEKYSLSSATISLGTKGFCRAPPPPPWTYRVPYADMLHWTPLDPSTPQPINPLTPPITSALSFDCANIIPRARKHSHTPYPRRLVIRVFCLTRHTTPYTLYSYHIPYHIASIPAGWHCCANRAAELGCCLGQTMPNATADPNANGGSCSCMCRCDCECESESEFESETEWVCECECDTRVRSSNGN